MARNFIRSCQNLAPRNENQLVRKYPGSKFTKISSNRSKICCNENRSAETDQKFAGANKKEKQPIKSQEQQSNDSDSVENSSLPLRLRCRSLLYLFFFTFRRPIPGSIFTASALAISMNLCWLRTGPGVAL